MVVTCLFSCFSVSLFLLCAMVSCRVKCVEDSWTGGPTPDADDAFEYEGFDGPQLIAHRKLSTQHAKPKV